MTKTPATRFRDLARWCTQHRMAPSDLERVARAVKNAYCAYREQYAPGYHPGARFDNAWNAGAMAAIDAGAVADIDGWVAAQFAERTTLPYPNNLHGPEAEAAYRRWLSADAEVDVGLQLRSYADIVRTWKAAHSVASILTDTRHGFPPVFVWCIARTARLPDIAQVVEGAARAQLRRPAYRRVYGEQFPDLITPEGNLICT